MGRLSGLSTTDVLRKLRAAGFVFDRTAKGSHEIWLHPDTRVRVTIPNHPGALPEGTVRAIVRQSGLTVNKFIAL